MAASTRSASGEHRSPSSAPGGCVAISVKANWHLDALDLPADDSAAALQISRLQSAAKLDLRSSAEIREAFERAVAREAGFAAVLYQECDLKWSVKGDDGAVRNPCRTCPVFCHDASHPDSMLCNLGLVQEDLLDAFRAARAMERVDGDMLAAVERELDAAHELAEAIL